MGAAENTTRCEVQTCKFFHHAWLAAGSRHAPNTLSAKTGLLVLPVQSIAHYALGRAGSRHNLNIR
jgi:hypothetical protein